METVGPPADNAELHLLTQWGDPASSGRTRTAGIVSILIHIAVLVTLALVPADILAPPPAELPEMKRRVTPLLDPITEFTQPTPNKGKPAKELDIAALQPRPRIQAPQGAPSTTRQIAPRPAQLPAPPQAKPAPPTALPGTAQDRSRSEGCPQDRSAAGQFHGSATARADRAKAEIDAGKRGRSASPGTSRTEQSRDPHDVDHGSDSPEHPQQFRAV